MLLLLIGFCAAPQGFAQSLEGHWHAAVSLPSGDRAYFEMALDRQGDGWQGTFINGPDRNVSSSGRFAGGKLRLEFNYWDGVLEAEWKDGKLDGAFTRPYRKEIRVRPFVAQRRPFVEARGPAGGNVNGEWILDVQEADGRKEMWLAALRQQGNQVQGTLIPVSGDYGTLVGTIQKGDLLLTHFDGIRTTVLKAHLNGAGLLEGTVDVTSRFTGRRADVAASGLPDAMSYTRMKNAREPLRWSFPDLDGKLVSSTDRRFRNKVVIVTITGSWCPNCHEEAPLLRELYERFHARGLEIVALGFEYTGEVDRDLRQLRVFAAKYALPYPVLLAGTTENAPSVLSQLENFRAYPTTIFAGRDGLVRRVHAGFDGPATGERHTQLKKEMTELVESLLAN